MERKTLARTAIVATPLLAALLYAALNWFQFEDMPVWAKAGPEARKDPFLAFERFLVRRGARIDTIDSPTRFAHLPSQATLFIAAHRLAYMTPRNVEAIAAWVERGGHLVAQREAVGTRDPLLDAFGIERKGPPPPQLAPRPQFDPGQATLTFEWPGADAPLRAELPTLVGLRDTRSRTPLASIPFNSRVVGLAFTSGAGRVTVVPAFGFLANAAIGRVDHAELGWLLASEAAAAPRVLLFLRFESPPLGEWIWAEAWTVVIAAGLLIALWLARVIPRFGPLAPEATADRRSLAEHIVASGRFLWARGQRRYLVAAVRERALRFARRRGLTEREVPAVGGTVETAHDFVAAVARLAAIESRLARRGAHDRNREGKPP